MDFHQKLCQTLGIAIRHDVSQMNPLALAYIGDTIYDLAVRTLLVNTHDASAHTLHVMSAKRVKASAQAQVAQLLMPSLDEQEMAVFKRGRNSKPGSVPKNASLEDYAMATGLETLLGWLYIKGEEDRLLALLRIAIDLQPNDTLTERKAYKPARR